MSRQISNFNPKNAPIANAEAATPNKINFMLWRADSDQDFIPAASISDQWRLSDKIGQRFGGNFADSWIGKILTRPFHESLIWRQTRIMLSVTAWKSIFYFQTPSLILQMTKIERTDCF